MDAATAWKITGVVAYLACLLAIGAIASRRMKSVRDYYAGDKRFGFWAAAFSARATGESAWLLLGLTGMGAAVGVKAFWVVIGEVIGVAIAWIFMCRRFKRLTDRYDAITVPDYLEGRFRDTSHLLRLVSAGALVVFVTIYVSAQVDATGKAFEDFLHWNYFAGVAVGFAVVLAYIVGGGFVAVVWSDVFQGTLMVLGLMVLPVVGIAHAGGFGEVTAGLQAIDPHLLSWSGAGEWNLLIAFQVIGLLLIGLGYLGSPQIFVRFLSLRSETEVRPGTFVAIAWTLLADAGAVLTGMVGRHLLTGRGAELKDKVLGADGEAVLPELVAELMPALIVGLFIAIVLSAIMSTVDSLLVVASSAAVRDWYQQVLHPEMADDKLVPLSRLATIGLALVALGIAVTVALITPERTVFWFVIFGWSGIAATFCPTMILSLFWSGFTRRGALAAMITGFLSVPLFKFGGPALPVVGEYFSALAELTPAFVVSALAGVAFSVTDRAGRERLAGVDAELREAPGRAPQTP